MLSFYMSVCTEDDEYVDAVDANDAMETARRLSAETGKTIGLRVILQKDGWIHYVDGNPIEVFIPLIVR